MDKGSSRKKGGFSLVEVMIGILVLIVLALGGAAIVYQTGGTIQRQQNKREAIIAANTVMEEWWNKSYSTLVDNDDSAIADTVVVNGQTMNVTISLGPDTMDGAGRKYMDISVEVDHLGTDDDVILGARRYEFGLSKAVLTAP